MPAGLVDHDYARRLDALHLNALYQDGLGEPLIRAFKKKLAESGRYHYVLVDSRTGMSEGAGICTRDLADHVMVLSGLNRQNVEGTSEFLREFRAATDRKKNLQIILSPIPNGEDGLLERRRKRAEERFGEAWGAKVELSLEIPYHPQLALTEEPHIFRQRRGYLFEAYGRIEASMLDALSHDAQTFRQRIMESLEGKRYQEALRDLHHMIRLDRGRNALSRVADDLTGGRHPRRSTETQSPQEPLTLEKLLADEGGRGVVEFIVDKLSVGGSDWLSRQLLRELDQNSPELAEKLAKRILEGAADDADTLGDYAVYFAREGKLDAAAAFYKRAVEADPNHANHLGNYASFLWNRERFEEAEAFYKRAVEADPKLANHLGNYASFLWNRERFEEAEALYKRALEADPNHANHLGNYANLLENRERFEEAEAFYKRAVEADPKDADHLGNYANFLKNRERFEEAEALYKRAVEADPKDANHLGNFGQFLVGVGRLQEGEDKLLQSFQHLDPSKRGDTAELCFSLWLVIRMQRRAGTDWERRFKFLIKQGFKRYPWGFDRMLQQAEKLVAAEDLKYAKALAAAFLDESKVADLATYSRWQALEPLDPKVPLPGVAS